jgi:hypothetical protein
VALGVTVVVVYGSGSTIARMAHGHERHPGDFETCRQCHRFTWSPDSDPGALVTGPAGKVIESEAVRKFLVP